MLSALPMGKLNRPLLIVAEKEMTEDEMVGRHHRLNGPEFV